MKEAEGIARFIKARVDAGTVAPGNILVLAPRRQFGYQVRDELLKLSVQAHSFFSEELVEGDPKNIEECKEQQALALLILLTDPEDQVALRCWCGFGFNNLNANAWARLLNHCNECGQTLWEALEQLEVGGIKIPYTKPLVERFTFLKEELAKLSDLSGDDLVAAIFPTNEEWAKPLAELKSYIEEDDFGERELLDVIRRHIAQPELPTNVDYVRVMSLHKSKGLTAEMVIVMGCLEGLVPSIDKDAPQAEKMRSLEEQRRLFYVAITRTKGVLVLSSVSRLPKKLAYRMRANVGRLRGNYVQTITSRFILELGQECPPVIIGGLFLKETIGE